MTTKKLGSKIIRSNVSSWSAIYNAKFRYCPKCFKRCVIIRETKVEAGISECLKCNIEFGYNGII